MTLNERKSRHSTISIVENIPPLTKARLGDMYYNLNDDKIYVRTSAGWKKTAALT